MAEKLLTDRKCKAAQPRADRPTILSDGNGLRLFVAAKERGGAKYWQLRYTRDGSESTYQIGTYPDTTLEEAREKATEARKLVAQGIHPSVNRKVVVANNVQRSESTFEAVAQQWLADNKPVWSEHHHERNEGLLRRIMYPAIGPLPIGEITEPAIARPLTEAYERGIHDSARKARQIVVQVFSYAKRKHLVAFNPARELTTDREFLPKTETQGFAALHADDVGPFLRALDASKCPAVTKVALQLMLHTVLREGAMRAAQWNEIDLAQATWTLPFARRKRRTKAKRAAEQKAVSARRHAEHQRAFVLPLPKQAVALLTELAKLTNRGPDSFVFASDQSKTGYLAENTLRLAMHGLGFDVTVHGFRSLLTDVLAERGFNVEATERQLDHTLGHLQPEKESNPVRRHYLRTDFLDYRRAMMQWVADWADAQKADKKEPALPGNVHELRRAA
jgi:integrase